MNTVPHPGPRRSPPRDPPELDRTTLIQLVADLAVTIAELAERVRKLEDFRAKIEKHGCGFYQLARTLAAAPAKAPKAPRPKRKK